MKRVLTLILLLGSFFAWSESKQRKVITAFTIEVTPFGHYRHKKPVGLYYDYANKIIETAGFTAQNKIVPFARAHDAVVGGHGDMTIMFDTEELLRSAYQSSSILVFENLVIPASGKKINSIKDLDGLKIGAIRSGCYDIKARQEIKPKFIEFNDYFQGIKMVESNRIDAICGSLIPMKFTAREMKIPDAFFKNAFVASKRKAHVHFSKQLPLEIRNKLNSAIEKLKADRYFEKLAKELDY